MVFEDSHHLVAYNDTTIRKERSAISTGSYFFHQRNGSFMAAYIVNSAPFYFFLYLFQMLQTHVHIPTMKGLTMLTVFVAGWGGRTSPPPPSLCCWK